MYRTRFQGEIVAEFLPPARVARRQRVIVLCDGMPSIPRKQPLVEFLAGEGYWVFYPRYRGSWESGGQFLAREPHLDILDVISELPRGFRELAFGQRFRVRPDAVFVIGGSFGGACAILCSLDERVSRAVANCPVVDWSILEHEQELETSNPDYAGYIGEAFGSAYRLSARNWNKLRGGVFFNPARRIAEILPEKLMLVHAKDDPYIPYHIVRRFARDAGVPLKTVRRGGHLRTEYVVRRFWPEIRRFLA
jgi:pimeloyl-ACP methyl ester carboxylesterase